MRTCPFLSEEAVEGGVPPGASAEGVLSDGGFACEAVLLQDFLGWGVLGVGVRARVGRPKYPEFSWDTLQNYLNQRTVPLS